MDDNNKQSSGWYIINPGPPQHARRPTSYTTMEHHPHDKNVQEDNRDHPPKERRKMNDHLQDASQQLLNEDRTIKIGMRDLTQELSESVMNSSFAITFPMWTWRKSSRTRSCGFTTEA